MTIGYFNLKEKKVIWCKVNILMNEILGVLKLNGADKVYYDAFFNLNNDNNPRKYLMYSFCSLKSGDTLVVPSIFHIGTTRENIIIHLLELKEKGVKLKIYSTYVDIDVLMYRLERTSTIKELEQIEDELVTHKIPSKIYREMAQTIECYY